MKIETMNELEQLLIFSGWFKEGRTIKETITRFDFYGFRGEIFTTILNMEERKILYTYPSKEGTCYRLTVQPDVESDIGV